MGLSGDASKWCGLPGAGGCANQLGRHPHGVVPRAARSALQHGPPARAPASPAFVPHFRRATGRTHVLCSEKNAHQSGAGECVGGDAPRRVASAIAILYMYAVVVVSACSSSDTLLFSCVRVGGPEAWFRVQDLGFRLYRVLAVLRVGGPEARARPAHSLTRTCARTHSGRA